MAYHRSKAEAMDWRTCMRCGRQIQLLRPAPSPALLDIRGSEQRGFQCIHCGQVTCFDCSDNRYRCVCGGNAWVARVYKRSALVNIAAGTPTSLTVWYGHE